MRIHDARSLKRDHWHDRPRNRRGETIVIKLYRPARSSHLRKHRGRFVTQTHALGASRARPSALVIVGLFALVLYVIGRRLSR